MYIKVIDPTSAEKFKTQTQKGYWVIMYYADWCPHCQSMKPEWSKFATKYQEHPHINVADVESNFLGNIGEQHKQNVHGFPTIVSCMKGRKINDFSGERTSSAFDSFANSTYKQNKPSTNINKLLRNNIKRSLAKTLKKLKLKSQMGKNTEIKKKMIKTPSQMLMIGGKKQKSLSSKSKSKKTKRVQMGGSGPSEVEQAAFNSIVATLTFRPITKKKTEYVLSESLDTMPNNSYFKYMSDVPRPLETVVKGNKEVSNLVNKGDVVICSSEGEKYVISGDKFVKLYQIENNIAFPEQTPRNVAQYTGTEALYFAPSWNNNERMVLNTNDYIIKESEGKYYSVESSIFDKTYNELEGAKKSGFLSRFF